MAIYTDGIDEAFNAHGEQFGIERFNRFLAASPHSNLAELGTRAYQAIDQHAGDTPQSDDITLMLMALPTAAAGGNGWEQREEHSVSLRDEPGVVSEFLRWLKSRLAAHSEIADIEAELLLVAEEVFTNILKYGNMPADGKVEVSLRVSDRETELCFSDPGKAFDPLKESQQSTLGLDSESAAIGGLGVHLLTALTDRQEYQRRDGRNILRLCKSYKPGSNKE